MYIVLFGRARLYVCCVAARRCTAAVCIIYCFPGLLQRGAGRGGVGTRLGRLHTTLPPRQALTPLHTTTTTITTTTFPSNPTSHHHYPSNHHHHNPQHSPTPTPHPQLRNSSGGARLPNQTPCPASNPRLPGMPYVSVCVCVCMYAMYVCMEACVYVRMCVCVISAAGTSSAATCPRSDSRTVTGR